MLNVVLLRVVQPLLRPTPARHITISGMVKTAFGNETSIEASYRSSLETSPTQITDRSFMSIIYSSRGSDCWSTYLKAWDTVDTRTEARPAESPRLAPWTLDRSTQGQINGSWVQNINIQEVSSKWGRVVNNVTLAIPHPGVLQAARASSKLIPQPDVSV
jgi:hypothetical protein